MKTMSEEKAQYIAEQVIDEPENVETYEYTNPIKQVGFAQIEHVIAFDDTLSDGAYRTYAVLISFAQKHDWAIPSVETLAALRGKDTATISRHLNELQEKKLIDRQRRMGTSSKTIILDLPDEYVEDAIEILQKRDIAKMQCKSLQKCNVAHRKNAMKRITREEEQVQEEQPASPKPATEHRIEKTNEVPEITWDDLPSVGKEIPDKPLTAGVATPVNERQEFIEKVALEVERMCALVPGSKTARGVAGKLYNTPARGANGRLTNAFAELRKTWRVGVDEPYWIPGKITAIIERTAKERKALRIG